MGWGGGADDEHVKGEGEWNICCVQLSWSQVVMVIEG